jgi:predicted RNase H-like HicB family nuclease
MIAEYVQAALERARYELIQDEEPYYGEVRELPGVWASGATLEECRRRLAEVLDGWLVVRLSRGLPIPSLGTCTISEPESLEVGA